MQGQGSDTSPSTEALEFEGRFSLSSPVTNNQFWWHPEQNPVEQKLPDFFPIPNDTSASYHSLVGEAGWNTDGLNLGQPSSSNIKNEAVYSEQRSGNEWQSSESAYGGPVSSNLPCQPTTELYQEIIDGSINHISSQSIIRPVFVQRPRTDVSPLNPNAYARPFGNTSNGQTETATLSHHSAMDFYQTGSMFREENNEGPNSIMVTSSSSQKRKFPQGSIIKPFASGSKRSVQITSHSGWQGSSSDNPAGSDFNLAFPSGNMFTVDLPVTANSGSVVPPRSSLFDSTPDSGSAVNTRSYRQQFCLRARDSLQDSVPQNSAWPERSLAFSIPPSVLPAPQLVGEVSDIQNRPIAIHYPVQLPQITEGTTHDTGGSSTMARNPSGSLFLMGNNQVQEMGLRNSAQNLQIPVITPSSGPRIMAQSAVSYRPVGGNASIPENTAVGSFSAAHPVHVIPAPNLVSNRHRMHRSMEQVRQALLAADSLLGVSSINHPPVYSSSTSSLVATLQSRASSHVTQPSHTRVSSVLRGRSNFFSGALDTRSLASSFETENGEGFISQARDWLAAYREARDLPLEEGVSVRRNLISALAGMPQDRHRDMRLDIDSMTYEQLLELGERIGDVKTGLSEETIMKCLKHTKYTAISISEKSEVEPCSICQEDYVEGEYVGSLECGHDYHTSCIKQWLVLKNSCPICKVDASSFK